jgi:alcohol dehydrogenase class IV
VADLVIEPTGRTIVGPGCVARLPELVEGRAFVVTDPGLRAAGIVDRVVAGLAATVFDGVGPNPSTAMAEAGAAALREFGEGTVVALGGGSALDAAKGIAHLAGGRPVVAVPTTAGTGSETNGFGVFECERRKVYLGDDSVRPVAVLLDPELTLGLPPHATAATGFDALVHGVESLASRGANPVSTAYAVQAVELVGRWLPVAHADGADLEARGNLLLGAHLAGRALTLSGLGLVHGFAHAVTAHLGTPHGVALAAVNAQVMRFSAAPAYTRVAAALGVVDPIAAMDALAAPVRRSLGELGATPDLVPVLAAAALADPVTANAPRIPTPAEAEGLLTAAL